MASIVLGLGASHGPQTHMPASAWPLLAEKDRHDPRIDYEALLDRAPAEIADEITPEKMQEHYEAGQEAARRLGTVLAECAPDVVVVVGDDQHEQFQPSNLPMFSVYYGGEMPAKVRSSARNRSPERHWNHAAWRDALDSETADGPAGYPASPELGVQLIRSLVDDGFDVAASNRLRPDVGLGHAFMMPYTRLGLGPSIPTVPIMVNTFYPPNQPTPRRCYELGRAIARAVEGWESDARVALIASGGLSHVVVDEELDHTVIDALAAKDADTLCTLPVERLNLGTSEIRNWITAAGALEALDMTLVGYIASYRSLAGTGIGHCFASWT